MMKKRLMIALCCLILLVQILPVVPMAETAAVATVDQDLYYCREQLEDLQNGKALLWAYDNIVAGIDACAEEIAISDSKNKLTMDEFQLVLEAVRRDHTEQFWLSTAYSYTPDSFGYVVNMLPEYLMVGEALDDAKVAFNQAIDNMLSHVTPEMTEYEKEKTLHDLLATKVSYVATANAHNAYGALVEGKAVCEGYAEALQCLLQRVGIQSIQVYGESREENHAWNMVRIDGDYYLVDLTWNDQDTMLLYAYFNQTSAVFNEDHTKWRVGHNANTNSELNCDVFDLPVCTATKENYFIKNGLVVKSLDVATVGAMLKNNNLSVGMFIDMNAGFTTEQFVQWCSDNRTEIAIKAGISGRFSVKGQFIGREAHITFETCTHAQLKTVAAKPATCEGEGNTAHRKCNDCGKLFLIEVDAEGKLVEILNPQSVVILPEGHTFTIKTVGEETLLKKAEKCTEHDTYKLTCAVCGQKSETYTFATETVGEHNYATEWQPDNYNTHKRPCLNGCGEALHEAHTDADGDKICDVCGQEKTMLGALENIIPDIDAGETLDEIIAVILQNPLILLGGGGSILLVAIIVIIKKIREG